MVGKIFKHNSSLLGKEVVETFTLLCSELCSCSKVFFYVHVGVWMQKLCAWLSTINKMLICTEPLQGQTGEQAAKHNKFFTHFCTPGEIQQQRRWYQYGSVSRAG